MPAETNFYLYFPDEQTARNASTTLQAEGYRVDVRLAADETNWLGLAAKRVSEEELDAAEEHLIELAESLGGEYDGFDRPADEAE